MRRIKYLALLCLCVALLGIALVSCSSGDAVSVNLHDGEAILNTVEVFIGQEYDLTLPVKIGYTFLGWYSAQEGGSAFTDGTGKSAGLLWKEEAPLDLFAHWQPNEYTVNLDYCGATEPGDIKSFKTTYDADITTKLPAPKKVGSTFKGWFTESAGGTQVADEKGELLPEAKRFTEGIYKISDSITLYAQWGERKITYMFSNEGNIIEQKEYFVGDTIESFPYTYKDNYCFTGWYLDESMVNKVAAPYVIPDGNDNFITLYAGYEYGSVNELEFSTVASTADREYEVKYSGDAERIVIPDYYYGKKVTVVRRISGSSLKEVILPQSIKELGNGAFKDCSSLAEVEIPYTVENIPAELFYGCTALKEITIPLGVEVIGKEAFAFCSSVEEIAIPKTVITIGSGVFRNMSSLRSISVDEENERYKAVDDVLYAVVGNSTYLVQYPVKKEGTTYQIDESTVKILQYAFSSSELASIEIGGKIGQIEKGAFENCKSLVSVRFCTAATNLTMAQDVFLGCSNLKAVKLELAKAPTIDSTTFSGVNDTFSVYVTTDMIRIYQASSNWRNLSERIFSLGTIFGDFAVVEYGDGYAIRQYFGTDKKVIIPEILNAHKITCIFENAFGMSSVEEIVVPACVTEIGAGAFRGCESLYKLVVECAPTVLGSGAFEGVDEEFAIYVKGDFDMLDAYRAAAGWSQYAERIWSYTE